MDLCQLASSQVTISAWSIWSALTHSLNTRGNWAQSLGLLKWTNASLDHCRMWSTSYVMASFSVLWCHFIPSQASRCFILQPCHLYLDHCGPAASEGRFTHSATPRAPLMLHRSHFRMLSGAWILFWLMFWFSTVPPGRPPNVCCVCKQHFRTFQSQRSPFGSYEL